MAHSAHKDGTPMGKPADRPTRKIRRAAHAAFDALWRDESQFKQFDSRSEAYVWMRKALGMTPDEAHIGNFDKADCKRLQIAIWDAFE